MSGWMPSTHQVRADFGELAEGTSERRLAGFDRWLAEVERAAAAKALLEAAEEVDSESTVWVAGEASPRGGAYWDTDDWLRARAEAYRQEGKE